MKKLFISQPMRGKSKDEILIERAEAVLAAEQIMGEEYEVIDSYFEDAAAAVDPLHCLGRNIQLLATADVAYFARGWEQARGCRIENACAIEYGITVIENYGKV